MTYSEIEYAIEDAFERRTDRIDGLFVSGKLTKRQYDAKMKESAAQVERDWQRARDVWPHLFR